MNNLIIDTAGENIFLKIISQNKEYNIKHNNSRENFDKLVILVFNFLYKNKIDLSVASGVILGSTAKKEYDENYIKAKSLLELFN